MKHLRILSRKPELAAMAPDVIIKLIIDLLSVMLPLFQNKTPQNPGGTTTTPSEDGDK